MERDSEIFFAGAEVGGRGDDDLLFAEEHIQHLLKWIRFLVEYIVIRIVDPLTVNRLLGLLTSGGAIRGDSQKGSVVSESALSPACVCFSPIGGSQ